MKLSLLLAFTFILGGLGYWVYQGEGASHKNATTYRQLSTEANCFLQEASCHASDKQAQIMLSLNPQPVPLMKPIQASLQLSGLSDIDAIELKVEGLNMYMGFQTVQLVKQTATDWQGSFSLPLCSENEMHWQVIVSLVSAQQQQAYQAHFNLVTQR